MTDLIQHYSIDLETLDTCDSAVILTIAIVTDQGDDIVVHPSINQQLSDNRSVDARTLRWWLAQSDDARRAIIDAKEIPCRMACDRVADFFYDTRDRCAGRYYVWGNSPSFDCNILSDFLVDYGGGGLPTKFWPYWAERDVRTARMAVGKTQPTIAHDALSDAYAQLADVKKFEQLVGAKAVVR